VTNLAQTADDLARFLMARVPVVVLRAQEHSRAIDVVHAAAGRLSSLPFYIHSPANGLTDMEGRSTQDDRSLAGAVEYATNAFRSRKMTNFVFIDVDGIDSDSGTAKHFVEVARLAEDSLSCLIFITAGPIWSGLARLGMTAELDLPDVDELAHQIAALIDANRAGKVVEWGPAEVRQAAETLQGITGTEATNIISTVLAKNSLTRDDMAELSRYKDRIFGELAGLERIKLKEDDYQVGGLESLRAWLRDREQLIKADLSNSPVPPPKGVLLCGVPGCGKSLSAKAIAAEWKLPLYRLDMGAILGKYVGESEGRLREALDTADRVAPCVLWIDEIEKGLAGGEDSGVTRRLVGQFLFWLQESVSKVFMVATANDVGSLPPELLRKGRFDEIFFVDLPDESEREDIIRLYFRRYMSTDPSPYLMEDLVRAADGFAGSDLEAACREIKVRMMLDKTNQLPDDSAIIAHFRAVVPFSRSNPEDVAAIRAWGRDRAVPASRQTGAAAAPGQAGVRQVLSFETNQ